MLRMHFILIHSKHDTCSSTLEDLGADQLNPRERVFSRQKYNKVGRRNISRFNIIEWAFKSLPLKIDQFGFEEDDSGRPWNLSLSWLMLNAVRFLLFSYPLISLCLSYESDWYEKLGFTRLLLRSFVGLVTI